VRTNWKSKNFNPLDDPTLYDSSTDESEYGDEAEDHVPGAAEQLSERSQEDMQRSDGGEEGV
jgi:hypothetical protein